MVRRFIKNRLLPFPLALCAVLWVATAYAQNALLQQLLEQAASGDVGAQFSLGDYYAAGNPASGLAPDAKQALVWYCKGAMNATPDLLVSKAKTLETWESFPDRHNLANQFMRVAAVQQGSSSEIARETLGARYAAGLGGLPRDFSEAYFWLSLMPEGNSARGNELQHQIEEALSAEQLAAARKHVENAKILDKYFGPGVGHKGVDLFLQALPCSRNVQVREPVPIEKDASGFRGQLGSPVDVVPSARIKSLQQRAAYDQPDAQSELARHYEVGDDQSLPQDWSQALFWYSIIIARHEDAPENAVIPGRRDDVLGHLTPEQISNVERRVLAWKPEPQPDGTVAILAKAKQGDPWSIKTICRQYAMDKTSADKIEETRSWCLRAGATGDPEAQVVVANFYQRGFHPADYLRAYFWASLAANYKEGDPKNHGRSAGDWVPSALQISNQARLRLAADQIETVDKAVQVVLSNGISAADADVALGRGPEPPMQANAERGYVDAQYALAENMAKYRDAAGARKWYEAAAAQGYPLAEAKLGDIYSKGAEANPLLAIQWLERAAKQSGWCCARDAQQQLIKLYAAQQDYYHSYYWALVAKKQADPSIVEMKQRLSQAQSQIAKMSADKWKPDPPRSFNMVPAGQ